MVKTLYAWRDGPKFYLSAFREKRVHDGKRPAREYDTETALREDMQESINAGRVTVIWEDGS